MTASVLAADEGSVRLLTLNRPDRLNAIDVTLLHALRDTLAAASAAPDVGAILLRGAGRAFCAGEDLHDTLAPQTGSADELRRSFEILQDLTRVMTTSPKPIVAAIHGWAIGGGAEIAMAADVVIAAADTVLRFPEVSIAHAPTGGVTQRLAATVGLARAKDWLLSGRDIAAAEALDAGLVTSVVTDLEPVALEVARRYAALPARSFASTKRLIELAVFPTAEAALAAEVDAATWCFASVETARSFDAFKARRRTGGNGA